ncbi:MAG: hypothetical protein V1885_03420 [Candidatus Brennerbacteria bacterium]
MTSKTPTFNVALNAIFDTLVPHERTCAWCGEKFQVEKEDIDFYRMLRVPPPTWCPECREKRRFGHLMRMMKFFKRPCSAPGHSENVISVIPPAAPHKTFDFSYWHSDAWDAATFGCAYDVAKPFGEQFRALFLDVPHVPLERDPAAVNSDYAVGGTASKNVYFSGMALDCENIFYSYDSRYSHDLVDCNEVSNSGNCYGAICSAYSERCRFIIGCSHCLDCDFLYECKHCSHCFMSANLRNKSYMFRNEQLSKEEYEERMREIRTGERIQIEALHKEFEDVMARSLRRAVQTVHTTDSVGDSLSECNRCFFAFRSEKVENARYVANVFSAHDLMDTLNNIQTEQSYENIVIGWGSKNYFSMYLRHSSSMEYCSECLRCADCFGCVGLKDKKFHIFNVPHPEDEYWRRVDELKTAMLARGEYGEFFPLTLGLFPYQTSNAQKEFPITEKEAQQREIPWYAESSSDISTNLRVRKAPAEVPKDIKDVTDGILNDAIACEVSGKPFRITKDELAFYRKMELPLPTKHPWERMRERGRWEHGFWLSPFMCPKCKEQSWSVYNKEEQRRFEIYCESCYLKEVI